MTLSYDDAVERDSADPLGGFRAEFHGYDDPVAYLDGNSLGRPPKDTLNRMWEVLDREWGERLIRSWEERWYDAPVRIGDLVAAVCLGAAPGQTVIADSTSVNLYKVLHAAADLRSERSEIVVDDANFPTDRYLVENVAAARGLRVRWLSPDPVTGVTTRELKAALGPETAVVVLSHVDYRSSALLDLAELTAVVHDAGAIAVWDLCHSVGVIPVRLDEAGVDFAVGCTYKYLNAGPGSPAFLYAALRHHPEVRQPIPGWWSADDMFAMADVYEPASGIRRLLSGTPNVVGIAAVEASTRMVERAGIEAIRAKATELTTMCIELADAWLDPRELTVVTSRDPALRGGHVSLQGPDARRIFDALVKSGIVPDFRNPDIIRLGLSPLSTSYAELWTAMDTLRRTVKS